MISAAHLGILHLAIENTAIFCDCDLFGRQDGQFYIKRKPMKPPGGCFGYFSSPLQEEAPEAGGGEVVLKLQGAGVIREGGGRGHMGREGICGGEAKYFSK